MNQSERGKENLESINDRNDEGVDKAGGKSGKSNGEAAGGDRDDVPGGAYNVPRGMAEEVSEEDALKRDKQERPER